MKELRRARERDAGDRPAARDAETPIVLVHGWGLSPTVYARTIDALRARGHLVFAPSIAVVGDTWTIETAVSALEQFFGAQGIAHAILVGHSLGGAIAARFALAHPEHVDQLVLVDSIGIPSQRRIRTWVTPLIRYAPRRRAARTLLGNIVRPRGLGNLLAAAAWVLQADLEWVFRRLRGKTMSTVVWGASDRLLPSAMGERMAKLLDARLLLVSGDHDWPLREPERLVAMISDLSAVPEPSGARAARRRDDGDPATGVTRLTERRR